jgi:phosphate starvation-inducible membrane PsiE
VIPAVIVFAIPALWSLKKDRIRSLLWFLVGGFVGLFPLIMYNVLTGGGTLTRAAAWILLIGRDDISAASLDVVRNIILQKGAYFMDWFVNTPLMLGQYVMPAVLGHTLQIAAGLMLIVVLTVYTISSLTKIGVKTSVDSYHRQFASYLLIFILFQWIASLRAARHFMPIFFVIPIAFFHLTEWHTGFKKVSIVIILLLSSLQIIGWNQEFMVPRFDARPVVKIMVSRGIREFYSSYWTGYPIMFQGDGKLIGSPMLLHHNEPFAERRPQYTDQVQKSPHSAFVFGSDEEALKNKFLSFKKEHDITCEKVEINGTQIFYNLSKPVGVSFNKKNWDNFFFLK